MKPSEAVFSIAKITLCSEKCNFVVEDVSDANFSILALHKYVYGSYVYADFHTLTRVYIFMRSIWAQFANRGIICTSMVNNRANTWMPVRRRLYATRFRSDYTSYTDSLWRRAAMDRLVIWMMPKCVKFAAYTFYYFLKATMVACYVTGNVLVICTRPGGYIETICGTTATRSALMALSIAQTLHEFREKTSQANSMIISGILKSVNLLRRISDSANILPYCWR